MWSTGDARWFDDNIPCMRACPVNTDVAGYIAHLAQADLATALAINAGQNLFAGTLGRTCSRPCEDACRRIVVDSPIRIRALKRAAADGAPDAVPPPPPPLPTDAPRVVVVGAGVAGLTVAHDLRWAGIAVTLYERDPEPGGLMRTGVPAWRLPRIIVTTDIDRLLLADGIMLVPGTAIASRSRLDELEQTFDAVVLTTGAQGTLSLSIPAGTDQPDRSRFGSPPVDGLTWLKTVNQGGTVPTGPTVVLGGSYTAVDCARTARRLSGEPVTIVARSGAVPEDVRSDLADEFRAAEAEGVTILRPASITGIASAGETPVVMVDWDGDPIRLPAATVIVATGQRADLAPFGGPSGDTIDWQDSTGRVSGRERIWLAGDVATGPTTFIDAIADGRRVATNVVAALGIAAQPIPRSAPEAAWTDQTLDRRVAGDPYLSTSPQSTSTRALTERGLGSGKAEVEVDTGLVGGSPILEASRCLQCQANIAIDGDRCILCNGCVDACPYNCIEIVALDQVASVDGVMLEPGHEKTRKTAALVLDEDSCTRCGLCVDWCPTACITMPTHQTTIAGRADADLHRLMAVSTSRSDSQTT